MSFDYIVIGGGSAGCLTAGRLVGDHGARVLLLEAGHRNDNPLFSMPAGFLKMLGGSRYLNIYESEPQPQLDGRTTKVPQANVLGGGSSVNGLVYMRGRPEEYAIWDEATGNRGQWGWEQMLAHYVRLEGNERLGGPAHGFEGPLKVSDHRHTCDMTHIFMQTMQQMGLPYRTDFNAGKQHGVGYMQLTADGARRCSSVDAFLGPVRKDPRLTLKTGVMASRLIFRGNRAVGVEYVEKGRTGTAHADGEIVLTAGTYATPKLLMLSGLGAEDQLRRHGIDVRIALPGVGRNLQDHHEVPVSAYTNGPYGYHGQDRGFRMILNGLQYMLFGSGPVASNGVEACAFINPVTRGEDTTIKLYCVPIIYLDRDAAGVTPGHGVTLTPCLMQPRARGSVRLRSANPADNMIVNPNFLGHPDDLAEEIAAIRYAREVLKARPMCKTIQSEVLPGPDVRTDEELTHYCKRAVKTNYHPVGTCRMGTDLDEQAVLTPDLCVRGIEGLRVFDASAMPHLPSANTNAPTMALADRGVSLMMGETLPDPIPFRE